MSLAESYTMSNICCFSRSTAYDLTLYEWYLLLKVLLKIPQYLFVGIFNLKLFTMFLSGLWLQVEITTMAFGAGPINIIRSTNMSVRVDTSQMAAYTEIVHA